MPDAVSAAACAASPRGFPVLGVQYVPHIVGEPYPHPHASPVNTYGDTFSEMYRRDFPLISGYLGANTVRLRPWAYNDDRSAFFAELQKAGVCKIVPSFQMARHYVDMLEERRDLPNTHTDSELNKEFIRFAASVFPDKVWGTEVVGWSLDLSIDLSEILDGMDSECSRPSAFGHIGQNLNRYLALLEALLNWVRPQGSATSEAPALASVPLLVPLDLSRIATRQNWVANIVAFLKCMQTWEPKAFKDTGKPFSARWLLAFSLPRDGDVPYPFKSLLRQLALALASTKQRALVMVGTQALRPDPMNVNHLVEDDGNGTSPTGSESALQEAYREYQDVNHGTTAVFDGFILDEWQDDWDRSARGPFFLALDNSEKMREICKKGGRFSHDNDRCARQVGNGWIYPEYFGQAESSSQLWQHCAVPRFGRNSFTFRPDDAPSPGRWMPALSIDCRRAQPSWAWAGTSLALLFGVFQVQLLVALCKWCHDGGVDDDPGREEDDRGSRQGPEMVGWVRIEPEEPRLRGEHGGHIIELRSRRLGSEEDAGWWLHAHLSTQLTILEKQVRAEVATQKAVKSRQRSLEQQPNGSDDDSGGEGDESEPDFDTHGGDFLASAMETVHGRCLEGFANWCLYVSSGMRVPDTVDRELLRQYADAVIFNSGRKLSRLFAECLLLRVMESLGEQILQCPERLSFLFYCIVTETNGLPRAQDDREPAKYAIDLERLQDGLDQMSHHSNPYVRARMPDGTWERGLNFDDINECGIQCRDGVAKTFREPVSVLVVIDSLLCYRVPLVTKMWTLFIAFYIYLGTGYGQDITTLNNGAWYQPQWLRLNFVQSTAILDAGVWAVLEVVYILYSTWQRSPSFLYRSPGLMTCTMYLEHAFNLIFSVGGGLWVYGRSDFVRKPMLCRESDSGECLDERSLSRTLFPAACYWVARLVVFFVGHRKRFPIFIKGNPSIRRFKTSKWQNDVVVNLMWTAMLGTCILIEVFFIFPSARGLDFNTLCGLDFLGVAYGLPQEVGQCSSRHRLLSFDCVSCLSSVAFAQMLIYLTGMVDIYFMFYIFSAIVGSVMGQRRHLNDLKNTSVPIDLRPGVGREARLFEETFGPAWQVVWTAMVNNLLEESYISPRQADALAAAARCSLDPAQGVVHKDSKKEKPMNLKKFPQVAAERLAFFFQSLRWIKAPSGPARGMKFFTDTDALTGAQFDHGTIPSLTMIIPAYNEVVIPSASFLRDGALREDAMNQNPDRDGVAGVGDPTNPPLGDGMNSNLAFIISQFPDEWVFLTDRLYLDGLLEESSSHALYRKFIKQQLRPELVNEIRVWAALRTQSVARTVIGALQYGHALASLPKIQEYYAQRPHKRIPEDHMEVILAHQTYGQDAPEGDPENDEAVRMLLQRYQMDSLLLVFDLTPHSNSHVKGLVNEFLWQNGGYGAGAFVHASVKCRWDAARQDVAVVAVLPRKFPLRLGQGDFKTQGKACNQLNGLRFASGHYIQALDCNMGVFIGEGFKVPYVLRVFMPLGKKTRRAPQCRYLGFRESIFTGREGTVGKCHASAEWTFGTIYQRFLSGMGTRMHYGHPDFVDGFWVRNRGGMSKSSPVVNLSEDIFAGYNVRMREEASPHIDALEFEKGRESTFNAASNFFSKISGGSIAVLRSRDNHLLCERVGIFHAWSFYFTSVAFYLSNLLIDMSIYLYVALFIVFTLANIDLGKLHSLGSTFSTEWIMSMGIFSLFPQLLEMILEFGALKAFREVIGMVPAATFFFIFQNKNIASAMRLGAATGIAKYFFTGRPMANQHQTWRDIYVIYIGSHYKPAFTLLTGYVTYQVLVNQSFQGALPMILVVISFVAWFITPIIFSPFPRWPLIEQDVREFSAFINGKAGKEEDDLPEVVSRGRKGKARTLWECGLAAEISLCEDSPISVLLLYAFVRGVTVFYLFLVIPAEILDFLWIYVLMLSFNSVLVLGYFETGLSNILLYLQTWGWFAALPLSQQVLGDRAGQPSLTARMPEFIIAFVVFLQVLALLHDVVLLLLRMGFAVQVWLGYPQASASMHLHHVIRKMFLYFLVHQVEMLQGYFVLVANTLVCLLLLAVDRVLCNAHTWWLLNRELARTGFSEQYLAKRPPQMEEDAYRDGSSPSSSDRSDGGSEFSDETDTAMGQHGRTVRPLLG